MGFKALLVANWDYADPQERLRPLRGPSHDLGALRQAILHADFGLFRPPAEIQERDNLTVQRMSEAFESFLGKAEKGDHLLLYYSGHGELLADEQLGLCGVDFTSDAMETGCFDTNRLTGWRKGSKARSLIVVLDCCYAGGFKSGGRFTNAVLDRSFGQGIAVLSSSGLEQTADAEGDDTPSPFTAALAGVLTDPELKGNAAGFLEFEMVCSALESRQLPTEPRRKLDAAGSLPMAYRSATPREVPELSNWPRHDDVAVVDLTFDDDHVVARLGTDEPLVRSLADFDSHRRRAIRRLAELVDAVIGAQDYQRDDMDWLPLAHKAWDCLGLSLFECVLPETIRARLHDLLDEHEMVKVRLSFLGEHGRLLEPYPWEYATTQFDDPARGWDDSHTRRPLAMRPRLLFERVPATPFSSTQLLDDMLLAVNTLQPPYREAVDVLVGAIGDGGMPATVLRSGADGRWADFTTRISHRPKHLALFTPLQRLGDGQVKFGFPRPGSVDHDWRTVDQIAWELTTNAVEPESILIETFAAWPGRDSLRATYEAARAFAARGLGPIVFVCHAPGFAEDLNNQCTETFTYLLYQALAQGKPLDLSVYWARTKAVGLGTDHMNLTAGVPCFYGSATPDAAEPSRPTEPGGRSAGAPAQAPVTVDGAVKEPRAAQEKPREMGS